MKKILFAIEQLCGGGAERVTAALMNEMCRMEDIEVHLLTYKQDLQQDYPADARIIRHNLDPVPHNRVKAIFARIGNMRRVLKAVNPHCAISLATPRMTILLSLAAFGTSIPLILSERNDPTRFPASRLMRFLRNAAYAWCDGLVFQTGEAMNYFSSRIRRKATVICNPITGNLPPRYEGERANRIVNFCRLTKQKNLDLLIDAFSDIADAFPEVTLDIIGEGPEQAHLEQKIREMNLSDRVHLPGYCSNVYEEIRNAALFVSSSDYEGISNSMLEAIALGVPTVCTDCPAGGARETIQNGVNGILVPIRNRKALAQAMQSVLSDKKLSESMSVSGSSLRNEINAPAITDRWMKYICKIVG